MAAEIRLVGGLTFDVGDRPGEEDDQASLGVLVGKQQTIRRIPLSEQQVIALVRDGATVLEVLRKRREAERG